CLNVAKKRSNIYSLSQLIFQLLPRLFLDSFSHLCLAFIEEFLALGHADLKLDAAVFPVDRSDDQGHPLLGGFLFEFSDLTAVKKELSGAQRFMVLLVPM